MQTMFQRIKLDSSINQSKQKKAIAETTRTLFPKKKKSNKKCE